MKIHCQDGDFVPGPQLRQLVSYRFENFGALQKTSSATVPQVQHQDYSQRLTCLAISREVRDRAFVAVVEHLEIFRRQISNGHTGAFIFYESIEKHDTRLNADRFIDFLGARNRRYINRNRQQHDMRNHSAKNFSKVRGSMHDYSSSSEIASAVIVWPISSGSFINAANACGDNVT